jgi:hypothetical protein
MQARRRKAWATARTIGMVDPPLPSHAFTEISVGSRYTRRSVANVNNHAQQRDRRIAIFKTATCIQHGALD